jgi:hypothetical protein
VSKTLFANNDDYDVMLFMRERKCEQENVGI